ncbi:DUF1801 domain-containing protein [Planctomicrobium sp. SH661]|uniref:DUF1801 domain-containing protein n=1 Tax=Planctomicrobium sp. SH661 TaxID=3448124 RepID=UPI003F5BA942
MAATRSTKTRTSAQAKPGDSQQAASLRIDQQIQSLPDWRGETLATVRSLIHKSDPEIVEECKWVKASHPLGVAVWSHAGIVCSGEVYKETVKLTFPRGAALESTTSLFNAGLGGSTRRAIDLREGEKLNANAFRKLIQSAVAENLKATKVPAKKTAKVAAASNSVLPAKKQVSGPGEVVLLSGGNPQIPKGDGDAPVQAYIAAMPGWKREIGKLVDEIVTRTVPGVLKAVKWNSPFYGVEGQGWFLSFHVFTRYVKLTFFNGLSLNPVPSGGTEKSKEARWVDLYENEELDIDQLTDWIRQSAALPGWKP